MDLTTHVSKPLSKRHPATLLNVIRPYDDFHLPFLSNNRLESPGHSCGQILQSIFGTRTSFPKINIYSGYDCTKAVRLTDGNQVNFVIIYFEGRYAYHCVSHGLLNL